MDQRRRHRSSPWRWFPPAMRLAEASALPELHLGDGPYKACLLFRRRIFAGRRHVALLKLIQKGTSPCCGDLVALLLEEFKPLLRGRERLTGTPQSRKYLGQVQQHGR